MKQFFAQVFGDEIQNELLYNVTAVKKVFKNHFTHEMKQDPQMTAYNAQLSSRYQSPEAFESFDDIHIKSS